MKIIKQLTEYIEEEICDSEKYITKSLEVKTDYPEVANTLYMLSLEELKHMTLLHEQVVKLIEEYRKTKGEPPAPMLAVYDFLHKKFIEQTKGIKILQDMYVEKK